MMKTHIDHDVMNEFKEFSNSIECSRKRARYKLIFGEHRLQVSK